MAPTKEPTKEPLIPLPINNWKELEALFRNDWPRGVCGSAILETQRNWIERGHGYGFKVFCPFGEVSNGMVAFNEKDVFYEIVIQCPSDDTAPLENALRSTKRIDWSKPIIVPFAPSHIIESIRRIADDVTIDMDILRSNSFIYGKDKPPFDVCLPIDVTFDLLSLEHIPLVDSKWPHRYPGSPWYFELLIKTESGYGLFKTDKSGNQELISWVFINESGHLGHMFTIDEQRGKGYAELLLKIVGNILLKKGRNVSAFCVRGNIGACKLYRKAGFDEYDNGISWCYLKKRL